MSGSPALGGTQPTSPNGLANQNGNHGITGSQSGINTITAANISSLLSAGYHELCMLKWISTKGSKLEYGFSLRMDFVLGLKHQVVVGAKTTIDAAWNRTYNSARYASLNAGVKFEVIAGKKEETIFGKKDDQCIGAKQIERVNGAWTHTDAAKLQKNEKLYKMAVDDLLLEFGTELNQTTQKWEADIKKLDIKAGKMREAFSAKCAEKCGQMHVSIKTLEEKVKNIKTTCDQFEIKAAQIDSAFDSALNIRTPSSKIKGSMVQIKASVQKFLADLVKLGE